MKQNTPIQDMILKVEKTLETERHPLQLKVGGKLLELLRLIETQERYLIEQSFEDGVGEGMTDPERPLSGQEYYDIKYKK